MKWLDTLTDTEAEIYGLGLTAAGFVFLLLGLFLGKAQQTYILGFATTLIITGAGAFGLGKAVDGKKKSKSSAHTNTPVSSTAVVTPAPAHDTILAHDLKRIAGIQRQMGRQPLCCVSAPIQPQEATQEQLLRFEKVNKALQSMRGIR